jgi:Fe-Mn family superoxide dismutase
LQKDVQIVNENDFLASFSTQDKFSLAPLGYGFDALEPHIDKQTMEIHFGKHHKGYVTNLNIAYVALDDNGKDKAQTLESIFDNINKFPDAIRNNAGGHYNHTLFWKLMQSNGSLTPKEKLGAAINSSFGSFENFKKLFTEASTKRFGSGWAWLVVNKKGVLEIGSTANQDNPLMKLRGKAIKGKPILCLDVWEHAYYLKNQNRRADYIASFWNVVNWEEAEKLFVG